MSFLDWWASVHCFLCQFFSSSGILDKRSKCCHVSSRLASKFTLFFFSPCFLLLGSYTTYLKCVHVFSACKQIYTVSLGHCSSSWQLDKRSKCCHVFSRMVSKFTLFSLSCYPSSGKLDKITKCCHVSSRLVVKFILFSRSIFSSSGKLDKRSKCCHVFSRLVSKFTLFSWSMSSSSRKL